MSDRITTEPQVRRWADLVAQLTAGTGVPPSVVLGLMTIESGGDPVAISPMNIYHGEYLGRASGLMQVMPFHFGITVDPGTGEVSPAQRDYMCDPRTNLQAAVRLLADSYQALQRWDYVAASYFGAFNWTTRSITGATDVTGTSGNTYVDLFLACRQWYLDLDAPAASAGAPAAGAGVILEHPNLRQAAGTMYPVLRVLEPGTWVAIVDGSGDYVHVRVDGQDGYVHQDYVRAARTGVIREQPNFRQGPGTAYPVIKVLEQGTNVAIVGISADYVHVRVDGQDGYVYQDYVAAGA